MLPTALYAINRDGLRNLLRADRTIKPLTRIDNDADAVVKATREFLRQSRLRELKAASGKVEFESNWQELEALELSECGFPS